MDLKERVLQCLKERGVNESRWQWYLDNISSEAIAQADNITDEQINSAIAAKELFWGLGDALLNYVQWERNQI